MFFKGHLASQNNMSVAYHTKLVPQISVSWYLSLQASSQHLFSESQSVGVVRQEATGSVVSAFGY